MFRVDVQHVFRTAFEVVGDAEYLACKAADRICAPHPIRVLQPVVRDAAGVRQVRFVDACNDVHCVERV